MLSNRAKKWLRSKVDQWADRFYEGPQPPARFRAHTILFANLYPTATRKEWMDFAVDLANEAYRSAWINGVEWSERDPKPPAATPEEIADLIDPTWRESPPIELAVRLDEEVLEDRDDGAIARDTLKALLDYFRKGNV
jgi:hypothetical protein